MSLKLGISCKNIKQKELNKEKRVERENVKERKLAALRLIPQSFCANFMSFQSTVEQN